MKKLLLFVFMFFPGLIGSINNASALDKGELVPNFTLDSSQKKKVSLADFKGQIVVLEWTNQECPFVKKHYSSNNMQNLQGESVGKGVIWLSIVSSAPGKQGYVTTEQAEKIRLEKGFKSTALLLDPEGKTGKAYGAKTTPHIFIIDREGKLAYQGAIDDHPSTDAKDIPKSKNYVQEALTDILAGQKVRTAQTSSYGCGVKY